MNYNEPTRRMEEELARLRLVEEEHEPGRDNDEVEEFEEDYWLCLVGKALTNSDEHFLSLRNVLAKIWHSIEGVTISELEDKRVLFRFYNEIDL